MWGSWSRLLINLKRRWSRWSLFPFSIHWQCHTRCSRLSSWWRISINIKRISFTLKVLHLSIIRIGKTSSSLEGSDQINPFVMLYVCFVSLLVTVVQCWCCRHRLSLPWKVLRNNIFSIYISQYFLIALSSTAPVLCFVSMTFSAPIQAVRLSLMHVIAWYLGNWKLVLLLTINCIISEGGTRIFYVSKQQLRQSQGHTKRETVQYTRKTRKQTKILRCKQSSTAWEVTSREPHPQELHPEDSAGCRKRRRRRRKRQVAASRKIEVVIGKVVLLNF